MAASRNVYQQKTVVSVPKQELMENVVLNTNLGKKELRIVLFLLTELDGWSEPINGGSDPKNFKVIDFKRIAKTLDMDTKDVKKSIKSLVHEWIIEQGNSNSGTDGYRFRF
jgi:hypothetical protein